jgi:hypothetical protein
VLKWISTAAAEAVLQDSVMEIGVDLVLAPESSAIERDANRCGRRLHLFTANKMNDDALAVVVYLLGQLRRVLVVHLRRGVAPTRGVAPGDLLQALHIVALQANDGPIEALLRFVNHLRSAVTGNTRCQFQGGAELAVEFVSAGTAPLEYPHVIAGSDLQLL